jgi:hypothetical protein
MNEIKPVHEMVDGTHAATNGRFGGRQSVLGLGTQRFGRSVATGEPPNAKQIPSRASQQRRTLAALREHRQVRFAIASRPVQVRGDQRPGHKLVKRARAGTRPLHGTIQAEQHGWMRQGHGRSETGKGCRKRGPVIKRSTEDRNASEETK